jgi:hypothetical protein
LNWARLAKKSGNEEPAKGPARGGEGTARETKLPDVSGELIVADARITYEDASRQQQPVYVRNGQAHFTIPDINQPITDSFSADVQIGSQKPGTVSAEGTIAAVQNNVVMATPAQLDQTLKLGGLDVAAVMNVAGKLANVDLTGRADGQVVVHLTNGNGTADSSLQVAGVNSRTGVAPVRSRSSITTLSRSSPTPSTPRSASGARCGSIN